MISDKIQHPVTADRPGNRARWAVPAAGVWSLGYGLAGLAWALGGPGFPYGESRRAAEMGAVLVGLDPRGTGLGIALLGLVGALVAVAVQVPVAARRCRPVLAGFAWSAALTLLLVVPDGRALLTVGELLLLHVDRIEPAAPHQLYCALGGLLWIRVATATRSVSEARTRPGRRRERLTVWIAAALPLLYAAPRLCWTLGFTAGLDPQTAAMVTSPEGRVRELVFGVAAWVGGLLTLGLSYRWGERFPAPVPLLGNRRVPVSLAVVPAGLVSVVLIGAGFTIWRVLLAGLLGAGPDGIAVDPRNWSAWLGNLSWLPWGIALALATNAYRLRRRADRSAASPVPG
ncbi:hypothetical protein ABGB07_01485 [Micromonosporaceae bacterium B7E4]